MEAWAYASLVSCLPALEDVILGQFRPSTRGDLGCLLEALARCPRLRALDLDVAISRRHMGGDPDLPHGPFPDSSAFAKLSGLTKMSLTFDMHGPYTLSDAASALVPLTGLAELTANSPRRTVVPAALGQLKGLRSLQLRNM